MACEAIKSEGPMDSQVFVTVQLEHRKTERRFTVVCLHLKASDEYFPKREKQIKYVLEFVKRHLLDANDENRDELRKKALIMCGDFNGGPEEKYYEHIVNDGELGQMTDSYTIDGVKQPTLYVVRQAEQLERVKKTLDFIFYSKETLQLTENLQLPAEDETTLDQQGLPNLRHSSDHFSLVSSFRFR